MNAVIGDMTISSGGVLRLNKSLVDSIAAKPGDRLIILQDTETSKITIQIQRERDVIFLLNEGTIVKNKC